MIQPIDERGNLVEQIEQQFCALIYRAAYHAGNALEMPGEAAQRLLINPRRIHEAYENLRKDGVIECDATGCYFVTDDAMKLARQRLTELAQDQSRLVITDANGKRADSFPARRWLQTSSPSPFLVSLKSDRILAVDLPPEGKTIRTAPPVYILHDLKTHQRSKFKIDGQMLSVSPDLKRAAIARPHFDDGHLSYSVHLVDLPPGREATLIEHDKTMRMFKPQKVPKLTKPYLYVDHFQLGYINDYNHTMPKVIFDNAFTQAVWVRREMRADTIIHINLTDGSQRELVGADKLPILPIYKSTSNIYSTITVHGFLSDGHTVVYQPDGRVIWLDIATGKEQTLSLTHEGILCRILQFSPDRRHVLARCRRKHHQDEKSDAKMLIMSPHEVITLLDWKEKQAGLKWIDDDRLLLAEDKTMRIISADGSSRQQVFPPPNRADWPAIMQP